VHFREPEVVIETSPICRRTAVIRLARIPLAGDNQTGFLDSPIGNRIKGAYIDIVPEAWSVERRRPIDTLDLGNWRLKGRLLQLETNSRRATGTFGHGSLV